MTQLAMIRGRGACATSQALRWLHEAEATALRTEPDARQRVALRTAEGVILAAA
ncbi:MAG: hypothetical protein U0168_15390 [Nannocystaceae bacterium]